MALVKAISCLIFFWLLMYFGIYNMWNDDTVRRPQYNIYYQRGLISLNATCMIERNEKHYIPLARCRHYTRAKSVCVNDESTKSSKNSIDDTQ